MFGVTQITPLLDRIEYWTGDWRTAYLTHSRPDQHPDVAIVMIDADTLLDYPAYSPLDRNLLAKLVKVLDESGARTVGFDVIFDKATSSDSEFLNAVRSTKSASVVLGVADERYTMRDHQRKFQSSFLKQAGRPYGYFGAIQDLDGIVRSIARPPIENPKLRSFSEVLAREGGAPERPRPERIAWLQRPEDGASTFATIPADILLGNNKDPRAAASVRAIVKDRIVIVGSRLKGSADWHKTPLAAGGPEELPGVEINAHVVAQLLDGRSYLELRRPWDLLIAAVLAFTGYIVGWRWGGHWLLDTGIAVVTYVVLDVLVFSLFDVILPYGIPALAWLIALYAGRHLAKRENAEAAQVV